MAQDAGISSVWAKYGQAELRSEYNLLREVTHWDDEEVEMEKRITQRNVNPRIVLGASFSELLDHFEFGEAHASAR